MFPPGGHSLTVPGAAHLSLILQQTFAEWPVLDRCQGNRCHVSAPRSSDKDSDSYFLFLEAIPCTDQSDCLLWWVPRRHAKRDGGEKGPQEGRDDPLQTAASGEQEASSYRRDLCPKAWLVGDKLYGHCMLVT